MESHPILRSLLTTTTTTTTTATETTNTIIYEAKSVSPNDRFGILFRMLVISFIGIISIWANNEAAKGFSINVVNDAGTSSLSGKRFRLFYESNDEAVRIVLNTSTFVENILYPNENSKHKKKTITSVTLRLAPTEIPSIVSVDSPKNNDYVISLSPLLFESINNNRAVVLAVLQGMARVLLWDGNRATPPVLLDGMVEYISSLAGFTRTELIWNSRATVSSLEHNDVCWKAMDPRKVAAFLRYWDENKKPGAVRGDVIRRLNEAMRNEWRDSMMDDALGMAGHDACATYHMMIMKSSSM
ncbi:plant basic secretory protein (BSP) family protein [Artemisia annua]|uniref:Plant basic secretory protein (BSP) family protein n=1 Tax=Artemisia annua TaxID=35608 RepID=A0A2U1KY39_ARTAN|nr:plant basic secretory protein (BSP) family protein [Artemisia annua]